MNYFLAKTDPETYSIDSLEREGEIKWDGIHNYQALIHLKTWKPGDVILIYHSRSDLKIMGSAAVTSLPEKDEQDNRGISWAAKIKFLQKFPPEKQISLAEIKQTGRFNDFALVRHGRLSIMPCPEEFVDWLKEKTAL